jgi:septal ring factor EnvC (AmiA/AmiB activator)
MLLVGRPVLVADGLAADGGADARLKEVERSAEETRQRNARLEREAATLAAELGRLQADSVVAAKAAQAFETELSDLEADLQMLSADAKLKETALAESHTRQEQLLQALQRLSLNPPGAMIFAPGTAIDMARSAMLLGAAVPVIEADARKLAGEIDDLAFVRSAIDKKRRQMQAKSTSLDAERVRIAGLIKRKGELQDRARQGADEQAKRLVALTSQASDIKDLIQRLDQERQERQERQRQAELKAAAEQRARIQAAERGKALAEIEAQRAAAEHARTEEQNQAQLAAEADARAAAAAGKQVLAIPPTPQVSKLPQLAQSAAAPPVSPPHAVPEAETRVAAVPSDVGPPKANKPFDAGGHGSMLYPVSGRIIKRYGEDDGFGSSTKGLTISARSGAQIVAPYAGQILFAGPFKGYGQILIIDHGGGYHSLLAGMDEISGVVNQWVVAGEPVGSMRSDAQSPSLYLELRRQGQPINPLPWLVARDGRVSG